MPLVKCPDCQKEISDQAPVCPGCGRPMQKSVTKVEDVNACGLMGKPGTFSHTMNVGCAALIIGIIIIFVLLGSLR